MSEAAPAPRGHSPLGMSVLHRRLACPGSMRMEDGKPNTTSVYAARGTELHAVAAHCLVHRVKALDYIPDDPDGADIVQRYVDIVLAAHERLGGDLLVEHDFRIEVLSDLFWGTADSVIVSPPTVWVADLKTGAGQPVPIRDPDGRVNPQLGGYALGAVTGLPRDLFGPEITTIELVVVQPRLGPPQTTTMTIAELHDLAADLLDLAEAVVKPDAPLNPGDHCRFCRASYDCPALRRTALETAMTEFDIVTEPNHVLAPPIPSHLTLDQLGRALAGARYIETWIAGVEAYAKAMADKGTEIPGFKLVNKRGRRVWADEAAATDVMEALLGQDAFVTKLHSPTQAEKALKSHKIKPPADWKSLVTMSDPGTTLAPDHDPRPAVGPRLGFETVQTED